MVLDEGASISKPAAMDVDYLSSPDANGRVDTSVGTRVRTSADDDVLEEPMTLYLVKRLELLVRSLMDDALRPHGVTTLQYTALSVLARHDGMSSAALSRRSFVTPQTGNEMVLWLERHGLVRRERNPKNRRVLLISLTADGRRTVAECTEIVRGLEQRVHAGMDEGERVDFRDCLRRGYESLLPLVDRAGGDGPTPLDG